MSNRIPITVRLESFEGPLDLLLFLIQSQELDISKVSISKITDQYLAYVYLIQELNFDAASEFLVMAATLLHWKSRALLPDLQNQDGKGDTDGEAPLSQEELIRQLLEHQSFIQAGENLSDLPHLGRDVFTRANPKPPTQKVWREMNMTDLAVCYQEMLARSRRRTHILKKETVSIADKIQEMAKALPLGHLVDLRTLLSCSDSSQELVATFLAALEVSRLKKMKLHQEATYSTLFVQLLEALGPELHLASEFDNLQKIEQKIETHST